MNEFLLQRERPYLLGLSGGADSVALFYLLLEKKYPFSACHINHGLRGEASEADEEFVTKLCSLHQIPLQIFKTFLPDLQKETLTSLEVCARDYRHQCFRECLHNASFEGILLGHHADDVAETVLMNLLRGSSGIKGIPEESQFGEMKIIRPLLTQRKSELLSYLKAKGLKWREDLSNIEGFTPRNRIRNEALPLLTEIMGRDAITSLSQAPLKDSQPGIDGFISALEIEDPQGRLFLPKLKSLPPASQRQVLFSYLQKAQIPNLDQATLERCCALIHQLDIAKINLPSGKALRRKEGRLFLDEQ